MFVRPKPDGSWRSILNLKVSSSCCLKLCPVNKDFILATECTHWEVDIQDGNPEGCSKHNLPGMHGASIDLKDAYYHILIVKKHRKYLRVWIQNISFIYISYYNSSIFAVHCGRDLLWVCRASNGPYLQSKDLYSCSQIHFNGSSKTRHFGRLLYGWHSCAREERRGVSEGCRAAIGDFEVLRICNKLQKMWVGT